MFRSLIFWKLTGAVVGLVVLGTAVIWLVAVPGVEEQALGQLQESLTSQARLLREPARELLAGEDPERGLAALSSLADPEGTRITVIRADGVVLFDSRKDAKLMENHGRRPEVLLARERGGPARVLRYSRTLDREMMYVAVPLGDAGFVRTAIDLNRVEVSLSRLRDVILGTVAISAGLALLAGLVLSRHLTRRVEKMNRAARSIANGDYEVRLPHRGRDEIAGLALSLKEMSSQLRERMITLTKERNELLAILGSMVEGVVAVDREERVVHMNENAGATLGCDASSSVGQRIWEVCRIHPVRETISAVLADGSEVTREVRIADAGRERVLDLIGSPLRGAKDELAGAVLVLFDVTELRRLEIVRRDFVVNVSHELKTPLTAIRGLIETLLDDESMEAATRRNFLARVNDQVVRLSTLVSDLLVLSRVELEGEGLERGPVELEKTLAESAARLSPEARGRAVEFDLTLPDRPAVVSGDEESLRQVVDNLLDNALKYTPDGGRIALRLLLEEGEAVIEVEDTGIGIEEKHLGRIFERFYRVDKARSRELGGTGLGLSIVKHIVSSHGGRVAVRSRPGEGSTFRVTLPLCPPRND